MAEQGVDLEACPDYEFDSEKEEEDAEDVKSSSDDDDSAKGSDESDLSSLLAEEDDYVEIVKNEHFDKPELYSKVPFT